MHSRTTVASMIMIKLEPPHSDKNSVKISWKRPMYDPLEYRISFYCELMHAIAYYLVSTITLPDPSATSCELTDLVPGTDCTVKLLAVYNPASIDSGVYTYVSSLGTSVCKYVHFHLFPRYTYTYKNNKLIYTFTVDPRLSEPRLSES